MERLSSCWIFAGLGSVFCVLLLDRLHARCPVCCLPVTDGKAQTAKGRRVCLRETSREADIAHISHEIRAPTHPVPDSVGLLFSAGLCEHPLALGSHAKTYPHTPTHSRYNTNNRRRRCCERKKKSRRCSQRTANARFTLAVREAQVRCAHDDNLTSLIACNRVERARKTLCTRSNKAYPCVMRDCIVSAVSGELD